MTTPKMGGSHNDTWGPDSEYVEVLHDYKYQARDHRTICMRKGDIYMILKKSTNDWWQVISKGEQRPFFAPTQYIKVTTLTKGKIKSELEKDGASRSESFGSANLSPGNKSDPPHQLEKIKSNPQGSSQPSSKHLASHLPSAERGYVAKMNFETSRSFTMPDASQSRHSGLSSFNSFTAPPKGLPPKSNSGGDMVSSFGYSKSLHTSSQESSSSHTSKSSLNDSSRCSDDSLSRHRNSQQGTRNSRHPESQVVKSASHDELLSGGGISRSSLDISQPKAASSEELDGRYSIYGGRDIHFRSNQLSYRHRSSSVNLEYFQKEFASAESMKQGSLDKMRRTRLSKDPSNRRRSWAVEEVRVPDTYRRTSLIRGETQDAAIILDVPPKLPPKQKRGRPDMFGSSSDVSRLEGPIDIKLQEISKTTTSRGNVKRMSRDFETGHVRNLSDPLILFEEDEKRESLSRQSAIDISIPPIALPRKLLPPKEAGFDSASEKRQLPPLTMPENNTLDEQNECDKKFKDNVDIISLKNNIIEEEKENDHPSRNLPRETPTPDSSKGGKISNQPPSPQTTPQRMLFEEWGEYFDEESGRLLYYNSRTREKRWKPPRKGVHSVAIPEVPPHARLETKLSIRKPQPRSPTPDYPPSPKLTPKFGGWSYAPLPEMGTPLANPLTPNNNNISQVDTNYSSLPHSYSQASTSVYATYTQSISTTTTTTTTAKPNAALSTASPLILSFKQPSPPIFSPPGASTPSVGVIPPSPFHTPINMMPPQVPPSSSKPSQPKTPTSPDIFPMLGLVSEDNKLALLDTLEKLSPPKGWCKKYDAYTQRVYFQSMVTGQRWLATHNEDGKIYFYDESSSRSQWTLPEVDIPNLAESPPEKLEPKRISIVQENLPELLKNVRKDGFLTRTTYMREGRKVRKNWMHSWVRYIQAPFSSGSTGLLLFTKNADINEKKIDVFDLYPPCELEINTKKTSRSISIAIRNGQNSEVLLQAEANEIRDEWVKAIQSHEGMKVIRVPDKEESRKHKKDVERVASVETLNDDSIGIRDRLIKFIRKRPAQESLVKKGIYKDQVFGSTLGILYQLDKTLVPLFILQCIKSIEKNEENLQTDGLYRISGNAAIIQKIRFEVARSNYQILDEERDVHNLSGALKLFFRELKEPVVPFANYRSFIQATGSEFRRTDRQADMLKSAVLALPKENYETLKVLLQHLLRVSQFESENRMSVMNLAIVFGPCLLWPESSLASDLMTDVMLHNRVIEGLLADNDKIFM